MSSINDLEVEFLVQELGVPTMMYNDGWYKWLGTKGQTGSYNDRWFGYLGSKGLTGSYNDRLTTAFCTSVFT